MTEKCVYETVNSVLELAYHRDVLYGNVDLRGFGFGICHQATASADGDKVKLSSPTIGLGSSIAVDTSSAGKSGANVKKLFGAGVATAGKTNAAGTFVGAGAPAPFDFSAAGKAELLYVVVDGVEIKAILTTNVAVVGGSGKATTSAVNAINTAILQSGGSHNLLRCNGATNGLAVVDEQWTDATALTGANAPPKQGGAARFWRQLELVTAPGAISC